MAYRPIIGDSGFFTLKEPYSVLLTPTTLYPEVSSFIEDVPISVRIFPEASRIIFIASKYDPGILDSLSI